MSRLDELNHAAIRDLGTCSLNSGALAINAAGAATFKTTATINYKIDGVFYSKAAFAAQAFPATTYTVKQGYSTFFLVYLDSVGAVGVAQGVLAGVCGETIVWGPGAIAQAHTVDEYIETGSLEAGRETLRRFLLAAAQG